MKKNIRKHLKQDFLDGYWITKRKIKKFNLTKFVNKKAKMQGIQKWEEHNLISLKENPVPGLRRIGKRLFDSEDELLQLSEMEQAEIWCYVEDAADEIKRLRKEIKRLDRK